MDERYLAVYRELYGEHWWWRARERLLLEHVARRAPAGGFGPILDIGCGDGLFFAALRRFGRPEGLETPRPGPPPSSPWGPIHLNELGSFRSPHRFGLVLLLDTLEHVEDDRRFLESARRQLAPGGLLLLTVPAFRALWSAHDAINSHRRRYSRIELVELAERAGLVVDDVRYFCFWTAIAKWLQARRERLFGAPGDAIPRVPPPALNRFLIRLCRWEQRLLPNPPFGSSLLLVARSDETRSSVQARTESA